MPFIQRATNDSFSSLLVLLLPSRYEQSTGVSVRATTVEANSATMNAMPSGTSMRPSIPLRKNKGMKLATMISVELRIGIRTSFEALNTTSSVLSRSASAF